MSSSERSARIQAVAGELESLIAEGRTADVTPAEMQRLVTAAIRAYATKAEHEGAFPVVPFGALTATDAMIASSAILAAANVQVFELGLWQSWARG